MYLYTCVVVRGLLGGSSLPMVSSSDQTQVARVVATQILYKP